MTSVKRLRVERALSRSGLPDLDYSLNPYVGCLHGCLYCYARSYTRVREVVEAWGEVVYVKENLLEVLDRETRRLKPGVVGVSTITDPYQPIEETERLTRRSIEILLRRGFKVSVQTKSPLVLRDLDLLVAHKKLVDVGFTIITLEQETSSLLEPRAPSPRERARALAKVAEEGLRAWLFYGPVIPGVNDRADVFLEVLRSVGSKVDLVLLDRLRLTKEVESSLRGALKDFDSVAALARSRGWWSRVVDELMEVCEEVGVKCVPSLAEPTERTSRDLGEFSSKRSSA